jgi:tetratricopeptide (TPR) repeat protein
MDHPEFAMRLATSSPDDQAVLLARDTTLVDADLARGLKAIYFDSYSSDPLRAGAAAQALSAIAAITPHPEVQALATWVEGLALLQLEGRVEPAITRIDQAATQFDALGQPHTAAETQIGKIFALARLGRYEEAIACGLQARDLLLAYGDQFSAGRVELNLGNIYHRCDAYHEAEHFYREARQRFTAVGDQRMLIYVDNGLANVLSLQHQFRAAAELYEGALVSAEAIGLEVTQAEIECNLGVLALFQGRYDRALHHLERSRRRYAALNMPHESAVAEQELADA